MPAIVSQPTDSRNEILLVPEPRADGALVVGLPCRGGPHRVEILRSWLWSDGRFCGRLACTELDCRTIYERARVVLP